MLRSDGFVYVSVGRDEETLERSGAKLDDNQWTAISIRVAVALFPLQRAVVVMASIDHCPVVRRRHWRWLPAIQFHRRHPDAWP